MKKCPRCAAEVSENSEVCPRCGLPVCKFEKFEQKISNLEFDSSAKTAYSSNVTKEEKRAQKKAEKQAKKLAKKEAKKERKIRESVSDTDFTIYALNNKNGVHSKKYQDNFAGRRQRSKDKSKYPCFTIDAATGEFNIDTSDVEIVGEKTGRIIEEQHQTNSIKKARGDYRPERIKWWELYKLADRHFARRKIKKQVGLAARIKPSFISRGKALLLAIFFGWSGAHNFYVKNYKKGAFSLITLVIWMGVYILSGYSKFFASITVSVGGFAGFLNIFVWISDVVNLVFGNFKYRLQKEAFLSKLNFSTRAKLGEKYYDMELYKKPWYVRLKAWWNRKKRNHEEAARDRRQNKIEREKRRAEREIKKQQMEQEFQNAEKLNQQEKPSTNSATQANKNLEKVKAKTLDNNTLRKISSFSNSDVSAYMPSKERKESAENVDKTEANTSENALKKKKTSQPNKRVKIVVKRKKK